MKKLVTTRQLTFILIISLIALKVLFLPSLLAKDVGRDSYIFLFFMLGLDVLVLCMLLFLSNKYAGKSFYEIMQLFFGRSVAKIIMLLFCIFFITKCWVVFQSNFVYLNENLHNAIKWYVFSLPLIIVIFYMSVFGVNAFARLVEIMFPVIIAGFLVSIFAGSVRADFSNILPICENGFFSYFPKIFSFAFWFGDYLIFIVFMGNVKKENNFMAKVLIPILICVLLVTIFMLVVFCVFSYSAVCHTNSISDIMQVLPSSSDVGGFDWVIILIWDIALFLYLTLNVLGAFYCLRQIFKGANQQVVVSVLLAVILIVNLLSHFDIIHTVDFLKTYSSYFSLVMQYVLPSVFFVISLFKKASVKTDAKGITFKVNGKEQC